MMPMMKHSSSRGNSRILCLACLGVVHSSENPPEITFLTFELLILQGYSLCQGTEM